VRTEMQIHAHGTRQPTGLLVGWGGLGLLDWVERKRRGYRTEERNRPPTCREEGGDRGWKGSRKRERGERGKKEEEEKIENQAVHAMRRLLQCLSAV
jgi:hypothetical protein